MPYVDHYSFHIPYPEWATSTIIFWHLAVKRLIVNILQKS